MSDEDYDPDNTNPAYHTRWARHWRQKARRESTIAMTFAILAIVFAGISIFNGLFNP